MTIQAKLLDSFKTQYIHNEYIVLSGWTATEITNDINEHYKLGWSVDGDISVSKSDNCAVYIQRMVRKFISDTPRPSLEKR